LTPDVTATLLGSLPVNQAGPKTTRMMFVPYSKGIYIAFVLEDEREIIAWMKKKLQEEAAGHITLN